MTIAVDMGRKATKTNKQTFASALEFKFTVVNPFMHIILQIGRQE